MTEDRNKTHEARQNIVRRALRYRGAMDAAQLAGRYFWPEEAALAVLEKLREQGNVIMEAGVYYHAELYERARRATITERRQVQTASASHYAALKAACPTTPDGRQSLLRAIDEPPKKRREKDGRTVFRLPVSVALPVAQAVEVALPSVRRNAKPTPFAPVAAR